NLGDGGLDNALGDCRRRRKCGRRCHCGARNRRGRFRSNYQHAAAVIDVNGFMVAIQFREVRFQNELQIIGGWSMRYGQLNAVAALIALIDVTLPIEKFEHVGVESLVPGGDNVLALFPLRPALEKDRLLPSVKRDLAGPSLYGEHRELYRALDVQV